MQSLSTAQQARCTVTFATDLSHSDRWKMESQSRFIYLSSLNGLGKTFRFLLRTGRENTLVLFLILEVMSPAFPFSGKLTKCLMYTVFAILRNTCPVPDFLKAFYHEEAMNFVKSVL